jgi:Raf kinase inhibitor-like YbhB/YbcL family protein
MNLPICVVIFMSMLASNNLLVRSPAFEHNDFIPAKFTCVGGNINPELVISDIPKEAVSLALIMDDPDATNGTFDHWIMWNIPVKNKIEENSTPGVQGKNGKNENKYTGPCPPSGTHHYHFKIYALNTRLDLPEGSDKQTLLIAMEGHVIGTGELIGLFKKK